ncbi:MAG: hypothetical protein H0S85_03085 [Desulfovibrionaceae bacterium]|jgi:hypothetical protein|nr:hypothetical protein [Desulfovibrionaceae bacterium]
MKRFLNVIVAAAFLILAASAEAASLPTQSCGVTIPEGRYRSSCRNIGWSDKDTLTANCHYSERMPNGGSASKAFTASIGCRKVQTCNFKLALKRNPSTGEHQLDCDD